MQPMICVSYGNTGAELVCLRRLLSDVKICEVMHQLFWEPHHHTLSSNNPLYMELLWCFYHELHRQPLGDQIFRKKPLEINLVRNYFSLKQRAVWHTIRCKSVVSWIRLYMQSNYSGNICSLGLKSLVSKRCSAAHVISFVCFGRSLSAFEQVQCWKWHKT